MYVYYVCMYIRTQTFCPPIPCRTAVCRSYREHYPTWLTIFWSRRFPAVPDPDVLSACPVSMPVLRILWDTCVCVQRERALCSTHATTHKTLTPANICQCPSQFTKQFNGWVVKICYLAGGGLVFKGASGESPSSGAFGDAGVVGRSKNTSSSSVSLGPSSGG